MDNKMINYTKIATAIFGLMTLVFDIFAFKIAQYVSFALCNDFRNSTVIILTAAFYIMSLGILVILDALFKLLSNLSRNELFAEKNVKLLNRAQVLSIAISVILGSLFFISTYFVLLAAIVLFVGLIAGSVKSLINKANSMKKEMDFMV